jgi:hypothetical protein
MKHSIFFLFYCVMIQSFATTYAKASSDLFTPEAIQQKLIGEGLVGQTHGASHVTNLYALTVRDPLNFFIHKEFPLVWDNEVVAAEFKKLKRHQSIRIFGDVINNGAPITHIVVTKFQIEKNFSSETDNFEYIPQATIEELFEKTSFIGRVHAIDMDGKVLVMEYKDLVVPVFIKNEETVQVAKNLFRGDRVAVNYEVKSYPESPKHLVAKPKTKETSALVVLDSIRLFHEKQVSVSGSLVKFPKSPQISTDTYAVLFTDPEGSAVQWTVVNFENPDLFKQVREKLAQLWNSDPTGIINGRNKLINTKVRITVTGTGNIVDPGQANPQILVTTLDQIQIEN